MVESRVHLPRNVHTEHKPLVNDDRGSVTVEAALVCPVFIVFIVLMINLLMNMEGYFQIRKKVFECAETIAEYSYVYEALLISEIQKELDNEADSAVKTVFEDLDEADFSDLKAVLMSAGNRLIINSAGIAVFKELFESDFDDEELNELGVKDGKNGLYYGESRFFYSASGHGALIKLKLSYTPRIIIGADIFHFDSVQIVAYTHAFMGDNPFERENDETELSSHIYRIGNGTKYHTINCFLINKSITEMSRTEAIEKKLEGCSLCKGWEASTVYVSRGGEKYHKKGCSILYPDLTEITYSEAMELGLEGCGLCIDDSDYFDCY